MKAEFSLNGKNKWKPSKEDWKILEDYKSGRLLRTRSMKSRPKSVKFKAQVVSNTHDAISAMYVIQFLESKGGAVQWKHTDKYQIGDFAQKDTKISVLIGGPKSPGIKLIANRFYDANKEKFLRLYSATKYVATILETREGEEGEIYCFMAGGPSKANTLKGACDLIPRFKKPIKEAEKK